MGVELFRGLVENNVGPIVLIAFTNHALDHMLLSIVRSDITKEIVRLGGRASEEAIKPFTMEELERAASRSFFDRAMRGEYKKLKETEEQIMKTLGRVIGHNTPSHVLLDYLRLAYPDHVQFLEEPPNWVSILRSLTHVPEGDNWTTVGPHQTHKEVDHSLYALWKDARDIQALQTYSLGVQMSDQGNTTWVPSFIGLSTL